MHQRTYDPSTGTIVSRGAVYAPTAQTWTPGNVESEDPHNQPFTTLDGAEGEGEEDSQDEDLIDAIGDNDIDGIDDDPADPCDGPATNIVASAGGPLSRSHSQPPIWI
jgi:hypothetical protein